MVSREPELKSEGVSEIAQDTLKLLHDRAATTLHPHIDKDEEGNKITPYASPQTAHKPVMQKSGIFAQRDYQP